MVGWWNGGLEDSGDGGRLEEKEKGKIVDRNVEWMNENER